jgi:hypothetical protein
MTAIQNGAFYDPEMLSVSSPDNPFSNAFARTTGIDPAYGSSSFGILITQLVDNQIQVIC